MQDMLKDLLFLALMMISLMTLNETISITSKVVGIKT